MTAIIKLFLMVVLGWLPFLGFGQTTTILQNDLLKVVDHLSEEQLARLINYAEKLQEEPSEKRESRKKSIIKHPNVFWKTSRYDLGVITKGDILFLPFKYINTSDEPYFMTNIKSSCGCVEAKLPKKSLGKNDSEILTLNVDTRKLSGETHITILIYDNSAPNGKSYLQIDATVEEVVSAKN